MGLPISTGAAQVRVTTSTGEGSIYAEKNLVDHMIVVDSVELEMAELAAKRTQNTAVRNYANMLINEHRGHLESLRKIAAGHCSTHSLMTVRLVRWRLTTEAS